MIARAVKSVLCLHFKHRSQTIIDISTVHSKNQSRNSLYFFFLILLGKLYIGIHLFPDCYKSVFGPNTVLYSTLF